MLTELPTKNRTDFDTLYDYLAYLDAYDPIIRKIHSLTEEDMIDASMRNISIVLGNIKLGNDNEEIIKIYNIRLNEKFDATDRRFKVKYNLISNAARDNYTWEITACI